MKGGNTALNEIASFSIEQNETKLDVSSALKKIIEKVIPQLKNKK